MVHSRALSSCSVFVSDFDQMLERRKAEDASRRRRRRKDVDFISDSDDLIVELVRRMKEAAEARQRNRLT